MKNQKAQLASRFATASKNYTKFPNRLLHATSLNAVEKIIIAYIGSMAVCYASQPKLSNVCGVSIDTIRRSIRRLEKRKIITVENRRGSTAIFRICSSSEWNLTPSKSGGVPVANAVDTPSKWTPAPLANQATINSIPINSNLKSKQPLFLNQEIVCIDVENEPRLTRGCVYTVREVTHRGAYITIYELSGTFAAARFNAVTG